MCKIPSKKFGPFSWAQKKNRSFPWSRERPAWNYMGPAMSWPWKSMVLAQTVDSSNNSPWRIPFSVKGFSDMVSIPQRNSEIQNLICQEMLKHGLVLRTYPSGTWANETFELIGIFGEKACGINQRINLMVFCFKKMHIITIQLMESHLLTWWPYSLLLVCHTGAGFHLSQWPCGHWDFIFEVIIAWNSNFSCVTSSAICQKKSGNFGKKVAVLASTLPVISLRSPVCTVQVPTNSQMACHQCVFFTTSKGRAMEGFQMHCCPRS